MKPKSARNGGWYFVMLCILAVLIAGLCVALGYCQEATAPIQVKRMVRVHGEPDTLTVPSTAEPESSWITFVAKMWHGREELRLADESRVDVYVSSRPYQGMWEVERAHKWKEAIGQAVFYRAMSGMNDGGVVLLSFNQTEDKAYILRCRIACNHCGLKMGVCDEKGVIR